jgi:hypothetical protein
MVAEAPVLPVGYVVSAGFATAIRVLGHQGNGTAQAGPAETLDHLGKASRKNNQGDDAETEKRLCPRWEWEIQLRHRATGGRGSRSAPSIWRPVASSFNQLTLL